ncbi:MAG: nucleotidyltransferase domain-containing protein [Magnetococcales bacterium]|nr:nucleotidyltransferase domain-containing protein [Magnetococcales bacterium]
MNWDVIVHYLRDHQPKLLAIYGFGSRMTGDANQQSDWDIGLLFDGKSDPVTLWNIAENLAERLDNDVDLVDLRTASVVMQYQIITTGKRLWTKNHHAALYESFILSSKTELDEDRALLLNRIQQEGTVHGR